MQTIVTINFHIFDCRPRFHKFLWNTNAIPTYMTVYATKKNRTQSGFFNRAPIHFYLTCFFLILPFYSRCCQYEISKKQTSVLLVCSQSLFLTDCKSFVRFLFVVTAARIFPFISACIFVF